MGWYRVDQGAGIIAATLGAFAVLFVSNRTNRVSIVRGSSKGHALTLQSRA